ncbi:sigma-70 family RNA polymerase sigma factor [Nocardioides bruguierae]|uniref:Sigma-70 family RNA polymerase sigma factor n=1 Tax=Nocardioides bruguierae TaxID=2945102 RepID=A0A9X2D9D9_9ACTN|nr:sigma-70 family RNA polymerase sigma factor [Nocardioides bruguierae]MCM0621469.1 sigma-70 family RNA polymerase sigma factor [Nocardioides bruguierae]
MIHTTDPHLGPPAHDDHDRPVRPSDQRTATLLADWHGLTMVPDEHTRRVREEVVRLNMPMARSLASRYRHKGVATDDLEQVAYLALVHAVDRYDVRGGHPFPAFAVPTIRGELRRYFRDNGWTIRPPRSVQQAHGRLVRSGRSWDRVTSNQVDTAAHDLDTTSATVTDAMTAGSAYHADSLDRRFEGEDGEGGQRDLGTGVDETADLVDRLTLEDEIARLSHSDQDLLVMRFVEDRTQSQIGDALGVSQVQVSRRLAHVLDVLRSRLGEFHEPATVASRTPGAA